jgi:hypothetical protein
LAVNFVRFLNSAISNRDSTGGTQPHWHRGLCAIGDDASSVVFDSSLMVPQTTVVSSLVTIAVTFGVIAAAFLSSTGEEMGTDSRAPTER